VDVLWPPKNWLIPLTTPLQESYGDDDE